MSHKSREAAQVRLAFLIWGSRAAVLFRTRPLITNRRLFLRDKLRQVKFGSHAVITAAGNHVGA